MDQLNLPFNESLQSKNEEPDNKLLQKFEAAFLLSAVGDALGWPLEFERRKLSSKIGKFKKWKKFIGNKWERYKIEILPGEYSDDTQLTLSVARTIIKYGKFEPEYFAYLELPLWLEYERGGGRAIKLAAQNLLKQKTLWYSNFFKSKDTEYTNAGANGAAMRNLPLALINYNNETNFIADSFKNTLITHGHPRAFIGSLIIGSAQIYLLDFSQNFNNEEFLAHIKNNLDLSLELIRTKFHYKDEIINKWLYLLKEELNYDFTQEYENYLKEAYEFLDKIPEHLNKEDLDYYNYIKALDPLFKGSGISTTCAAIYMFLKYQENPKEALINSANLIGSDTDTIASFVGSLIGIFKEDIINSDFQKFTEELQDKDYIIDLAEKLFNTRKSDQNLKTTKKINKEEILNKISQWKEYFKQLIQNNKIKEGEKIENHPILGNGTIQNITTYSQDEIRMLYKSIKIKFDCGQTIYFHYKLKKNN